MLSNYFQYHHKKESIVEQSFLKNNLGIEILTPKGFKTFAGILKTPNKKGLSITLSTGKIINCTENHKIKLIDSTFHNANNIRCGDVFFGNAIVTSINSIEELSYYFDPVDVNDGSEYLSSDIIHHNCEFLGSTESLLHTEVLKGFSFVDPIRTDMGGDYKIYKEPILKHKYIAVVDTAQGIGEDYSVINVIDVTQDNESKHLEQAACYRSNLVDQTLLAHVAAKIGKEYNEAMVVIENNFGSETATIMLNEVEYGNLYMDERQVGIKMTKKVKRVGVERLREMLTNNLLKLNAIELLEEFANFIRIKDSWRADSGYNDDQVMSLVLFAYFTKTEWYKDFAGTDSYRQMHQRKIETMIDGADVTPIIQVDDDGMVRSTTDRDWWV